MLIVPEGHIEGIFNYCTRRCSRCAFTSRCTLYQSEREYERQNPDATWQQRMQDSFAETFRLLEAWCQREGIDFDEIRRAADVLFREDGRSFTRDVEQVRLDNVAI